MSTELTPRSDFINDDRYMDYLLRTLGREWSEYPSGWMARILEYMDRIDAQTTTTSMAASADDDTPSRRSIISDLSQLSHLPSHSSKLPPHLVLAKWQQTDARFQQWKSQQKDRPDNGQLPVEAAATLPLRDRLDTRSSIAAMPSSAFQGDILPPASNPHSQFLDPPLLLLRPQGDQTPTQTHLQTHTPTPAPTPTRAGRSTTATSLLDLAVPALAAAEPSTMLPTREDHSLQLQSQPCPPSLPDGSGTGPPLQQPQPRHQIRHHFQSQNQHPQQAQFYRPDYSRVGARNKNHGEIEQGIGDRDGDAPGKLEEFRAEYAVAASRWAEHLYQGAREHARMNELLLLAAEYREETKSDMPQRRAAHPAEDGGRGSGRHQASNSIDGRGHNGHVPEGTLWGCPGHAAPHDDGRRNAADNPDGYDGKGRGNDGVVVFAASTPPSRVKQQQQQKEGHAKLPSSSFPASSIHSGNNGSSANIGTGSRATGTQQEAATTMGTLNRTHTPRRALAMGIRDNELFGTQYSARGSGVHEQEAKERETDGEGGEVVEHEEGVWTTEGARRGGRTKTRRGKRPAGNESAAMAYAAS